MSPIRTLFLALSLIWLTACGSGTQNGEETSSGETAAPAAAAEQAASEAADAADSAAAGAAEVADAMASAADDADDEATAVGCEVDIEVGDAIVYSVDAIRTQASCGELTVTLTHTGQLPKEAMGHNWVLVTGDAVQEIATAGIAAGLDNNYVPEDDRIIAATSIVGGGEATSITVPLDGLSGSYTFVCTFPGHSMAMQGTLTVEG